MSMCEAISMLHLTYFHFFLGGGVCLIDVCININHPFLPNDSLDI